LQADPGTTSFDHMAPSDPASTPTRIPPHRLHRLSVAFLERDGRHWACFLVTYPDGDQGWRGHFAFRPSNGGDDDEVRTAEIFVEAVEADVHRKARQLGRPLLGALLDSALQVRERNEDGSPFLRRWFRELLAEHSTSPAEPLDAPGAVRESEPSLDELRSLYASYRLDQVAHFIALVEPEHFDGAVTAILDGEGIDFAARDRLQFAMLVVDHIEARLPLPPFEVWVRDYLTHRDRYRAYAHTLHREGRLP
jgi:hypothetical protein